MGHMEHGPPQMDPNGYLNRENENKPLNLGEAILSDKAIQELTIKNKQNRDLTTSLWFVQEAKLDSTCAKVKPGIWLVII